MKTIVTCLFLMVGAALNAQSILNNLIGDWKINSFVANGKTEDASKNYFIIYMSDDGVYNFTQVYLESPRNMTSNAIIKDLGSNKFSHTTTSTDAKYPFWLTGTYTYTLSDNTLTLTGEGKKVVLERK